MEWFVLPLAALAGFFMTLSAIVVAYPSHLQKESGTDFGRIHWALFTVCNLIFTSLAQGTQMFASRFAPVSVVVAVFTGSNLLTNMIFVFLLRTDHITKNMVIGTLGLALSVATLHDIGPTDVPKGMAKDEVVAMLLSSSSLVFLIATVVMQIVTIYALYRGWVADNNSKVFAYAYAGGVGTILNAAIGKLIQMDIGLGLVLTLVLIYIVNAVVCLGNAIQANKCLEGGSSRFVPVSSGTNLLLVCLAGLCIWGDGGRLHYPLSYAIVYSWVVLAMFCHSTFGDGCQRKDDYSRTQADSRTDLIPSADLGSTQTGVTLASLA